MIHYENMTKEQVIGILKDAEEYIGEVHKDYDAQKEEIERLNNALKEYDRGTYCKLINENRKLNNIINELERYINEEYIYDELGMKIFDASKLQDKLQELKGSDKE